MFFKFQLDTSYLINEYLNDNKICILTGNRGVGKKYIINNMECDYNKYPIIENAYTINEFFSQLIIFNDNLNITDISIGVGQNLQLGFSLTQMMNKFSSFLKSDFKKAEDRVIKELENLSKKNKLLLSIQLYKNTSKNLIEFICNDLTKINAKIILIIDSEDISYLKLKSNLGKHNEIIVNYKEEDIYNEFEKIISRENIDKIIALTDGDIKSIIEIYNYLNKNSTNILDYIKESLKNVKEEKYDAYLLLEFLSYFKKNFTQSEIKFIYQKLYDEFKVSSHLNHILKYILDKNILKENNNAYIFALTVFKQILKSDSKNNRLFYQTIGKCIKKVHPLDLYGQLYYYSLANDEYTNTIKFLLTIRLVRAHNNKKEINELINTISNKETKNIAKKLIEAYEAFYSFKFDNAIILLQQINVSEESIFTNEADYLLAICYWKKSNEFKSKANQILEAIIEDSNAFEETVLLSKMTLLSIYSNDAQYHDKNILSLYKELKNQIRDKMETDNDYVILLNILRRKSNCVFSSKQCLDELEKSLSYFSQYQFIFPEEFAMSLCNYSAILLNLGNFEKCYNLYESLNWSDFYGAYKVYNFNNYILSKYFGCKDFYEDIIDFEKILETSDLSVDTKILTYINLAGLRVYNGELSEAKRIYDRAEKLNNNYDDYFIYFINTNLCVISLLENNFINATEYLNKCNFIPELFSAYEKQYLRTRNETLYTLVKSNAKDFSLNEISQQLEKSFEKYITNDVNFFSKPILFSDIQFWTEN